MQSSRTAPAQYRSTLCPTIEGCLSLGTLTGKDTCRARERLLPNIDRPCALRWMDVYLCVRILSSIDQPCSYNIRNERSEWWTGGKEIDCLGKHHRLNSFCSSPFGWTVTAAHPACVTLYLFVLFRLCASVRQYDRVPFREKASVLCYDWVPCEQPVIKKSCSCDTQNSMRYAVETAKATK